MLSNVTKPYSKCATPYTIGSWFNGFADHHCIVYTPYTLYHVTRYLFTQRCLDVTLKNTPLRKKEINPVPFVVKRVLKQCLIFYSSKNGFHCPGEQFRPFCGGAIWALIFFSVQFSNHEVICQKSAFWSILGRFDQQAIHNPWKSYSRYKYNLHKFAYVKMETYFLLH